MASVSESITSSHDQNASRPLSKVAIGAEADPLDERRSVVTAGAGNGRGSANLPGRREKHRREISHSRLVLRILLQDRTREQLLVGANAPPSVRPMAL